ncbi:hypothetical protein HanRHA438_Chr10g0436491 [Helianthus annuus]|nr:hypothetical protein HanOQP8_Chr10g0352791 [Helianthus annuus]KAJ0878153.1 hypothetical protein HanRHA438_Chr10g0436491 [Helianthus annuus]
MRDEFCKKSKFDFMLLIMKVSWPKTFKKWFNVKNKSENFHADDFSYGGGDEVWRNNFSEKEVCSIKESRNTRTGTVQTIFKHLLLLDHLSSCINFLLY